MLLIHDCSFTSKHSSAITKSDVIISNMQSCKCKLRDVKMTFSFALEAFSKCLQVTCLSPAFICIGKKN